MVFRVQFKYKFIIRNFGATIEQRHRTRIRQLLIFSYHMNLKHFCQQRCANLIFKFLTSFLKCSFFIYRLRETFYQILYIQNRFRNLLAILANRAKTLRWVILVKESFKISQKLKEINDKVSDDLALAIDKTSAKKYDFITESIIMLAKFDFRKEFLLWYLDNNKEKLDDGQIRELNRSVA